VALPDGSRAGLAVSPKARALAAAAACLILDGCGDMRADVALPATHAAEAGQPASRDVGLGGAWDRSLTGLRAQDQRVANVAYRIVTASVALCSDLAPQSGLVLQNALEYGPRLRPAAMATFHLDDRTAVEAIAAGSPAASAGLRTDDILLAVDNQPLAASPTPQPVPDFRPATYAPIEATQARITDALRRGTASITVQRGQVQLRLDIIGQPGCAYDAQVLPGPGLSASADGRHVFISSAMVSYARSDDMLALVLGHEFAHDVLHHHRRLDQVGFARRTLGDLGSTPESLRLAEKEADYVGLYLTARAGYDTSEAPEFWRRFPAAAGDLAWSHPGAAERAASLAATRDEIIAKRRSGQPLMPNAPA
jgi:hypothetical protein